MIWYCIDCCNTWEDDTSCPECGSLNFERGGKDQVDKNIGLYHKYYVERIDGGSSNGQKHEHCKYFVIDMTHDKFAANALLAYSIACKDEYPVLSNELREFAESKCKKQNCTQCEALKAEVERLKGEKQKLLDVLRPVAIIGNKVAHKHDIWEFLAPSGYVKAYEVYNEVTKCF